VSIRSLIFERDFFPVDVERAELRRLVETFLAVFNRLRDKLPGLGIP
jgi:hypothetical protein